MLNLGAGIFCLESVHCHFFFWIQVKLSEDTKVGKDLRFDVEYENISDPEVVYEHGNSDKGWIFYLAASKLFSYLKIVLLVHAIRESRNWALLQIIISLIKIT